jgi:Domain of unknown function (DUF6321)
VQADGRSLRWPIFPAAQICHVLQKLSLQPMKLSLDENRNQPPERQPVSTKAAVKKPVEKDPNGGLTAAGRKAYGDKEGAHLRPGVKGPADTPEKMRRKGSFLRRHYAMLRGPLVDDQGRPTRLALQARAWGEPAPKTEAAAKKLAEKGSRLLARYRKTQQSQS